MPHLKRCSAPKCDEYADDIMTTAVFRFPSDTNRCRTWVQNCGNRDLLKLPVNKLHQVRFLCAKHFESQHFFDKYRRKLHRNAIPTLFNGEPLTAEEMASFDAVQYDAGQEQSVKCGGSNPASPLGKRDGGFLDELNEGDAEIVLFVLEEEKDSPCNIPVEAAVQIKQNSLSASQQLETNTRLGATSSCRAAAQSTSHRDSNVSQSKTTPRERVMELIEKKYSQEMELIQMQKVSEKLKQEALREKLLFYKEKRRRLENDN